VCRQRFRILKIIQVEPYLIADVAYGFSGEYVTSSFMMSSSAKNIVVQMSLYFAFLLDWIGLDWIGLDWIGLDCIFHILRCLVLYFII
jgi:hypothetical protein